MAKNTSLLQIAGVLESMRAAIVNGQGIPYDRDEVLILCLQATIQTLCGGSPSQIILPDTGSAITGLDDAAIARFCRGQITATPYTVYGNIFADGSPWYDVGFFGAVGDGITDDTAAIQRCLDAAPAGSTVFFPQTAAGVYLVSRTGVATGSVYSLKFTNGPVNMVGADSKVTIKLANGTIRAGDTSGGMFLSSGTFTNSIWAQNMIFDGNGANQNFASFTGAAYFTWFNTLFQTSVSLDIYARFENCQWLNWTMKDTSAFFLGLAANTYSFTRQSFDNCFFGNCDYGIFVTQSVSTNPNSSTIFACSFRNIWNSAVFSEAFSNVSVDGCQFWNDTLVGAAGNQGVAVLTNVLTRQICVTNSTFRNIANPISIGFGGTFALKDSVFSNLSAYNCRGRYKFDALDSSCIVANLIADTCAIGGITGDPVEADFELNALGNDSVVANNLSSLNSGNYAIALKGAGQVLGGKIVNPSSGTITFDSSAIQAASIVAGVTGYNPVGLAASPPAFPLTTVGVPNPYGSSVLVYLSNGTGAMGVVVSGGSGGSTAAIFVPASTTVPILVPPNGTITPTYGSGSPSWVWQIL